MALCVGALALMMGAVHEAAGPFVKPPPLEQVLQDKAKTLYERTIEALRGTSPETQPVRPARDIDQVVDGMTAGLGALAVALALAAFARRESPRAVAGGAILGIASLPWQIGLGVVIAMVFVAATILAIESRKREPPTPG
jgi:hypothetical protein